MHVAYELGITAVDFHLGTSPNGERERTGVANGVRSLWNKWGVHRDDLFLITKLDKPPANMTDPSEAASLAQDTLDSEFDAMGLDSVDLLLLKDSATCAVVQAQWAVLESALAAGRAKGLGVYNFCEATLACLLSSAIVPPKVNFIMNHVGMGYNATAIKYYGIAYGIATVAYGTLGEPIALPQLLSQPTIIEIATNHTRTVEEVALQWNVQHGYGISNRITADYAPDNTPNGTSHCTEDCRAALTAMSELHKWSLTPAEMAQLDMIRFDAPSQSSTYYSSTACAHSFGVSEHPTVSACADEQGSGEQGSASGENSSAAASPPTKSSWC